MTTTETIRPYPEYLDGDHTKAILRDFPLYYASIYGDVYNLKTGKKRKYGKKTRKLLLTNNGKEYHTAVHIQVLMAFVPKPPGNNMTVDHIDNSRNTYHALENLRWATKSEQISNRVVSMPSTATRRFYATDSEGNKTLYSSIRDFAKQIGKHQSCTTNISQALKNNTKYCGYMFKIWEPYGVGEWKLIPSQVIRGTENYFASERDGWVKTDRGIYSQGCLSQYTDRHAIGITDKFTKKVFVYYVYRLTAYAFHGVPANHLDMQVNHIDGTLKRDANNLEWCTADVNIQHAIRLGLNKYVKKVGMYDRKTNEKIGDFLNSVEALKFIKSEYGVKSNSQHHITACCRKQIKQAYGFWWKYEN